jgi:aspartyl-tRNA synthetase
MTFSYAKRSHTCGQLKSGNTGDIVTLCGWIAKRRDHGGVIFLDLRDRYGVTQLVFDPTFSSLPEVFERAGRLRSEFVIAVQGKVRPRPDGMTNSKLPTGEIEVVGLDLQILSEAKTPPFPIEDDVDVAESVRLQYRYLDLRRPALQKNLLVRHQVLQLVRDHLSKHEFIEVETPILYKSTPEGARDFIVPSRLNRGEFYALPQSPQTLKQLLMIAGMDRYFQVARCFRDEDLRSDRQPEFSQIDIEASFIDEETLFPIMEGLVARLWQEVLGVKIQTPFARMPYREAMDRFGSDKPDIRFGLELQDLTAIFEKSTFQVFQGALTKNSRGQTGSIRAVVVHEKAEQFSRKDLDDLTKFVSQYGAKGLLWIKVQANGDLQSPAAKFFSDGEKAELAKKLSLNPGSLVMIVADPSNKVVFDSLGALRIEVGNKLKIVPKPEDHQYAFLWVTNFPLFEYDEKEKRYFAAHHPFTSPKPECESDFIEAKNLDSIEASAYDLVLNGVEVAGGSLRIFKPEVQSAMFRALSMSAEDAKEKFGFFLDALGYGTPPHGGIAFGLDRLTAILCGVSAIRDVMAFPKTQKGTCHMSGSPSTVTKEQLQEVGISLVRQQT